MKKPILFVSSLIFALYLSGCNKETASVGIIGGADGPTAILVTSNISWLHICGFIGILFVAIGVAYIVYRNKKK